MSSNGLSPEVEIDDPEQEEESAPARGDSVQVFVIFDVEHDQELFDRLHTQSETPSFGFEIMGCSKTVTSSSIWRERTGRRIREADQVVILCGEHTGDSPSMSSELLMARNEGTPYFLLWGRREVMCTKPMGAKPDEGMFSWTRQNLANQIALTLRTARTDATARSLRNPAAKARASLSGVGSS